MLHLMLDSHSYLARIPFVFTAYPYRWLARLVPIIRPCPIEAAKLTHQLSRSPLPGSTIVNYAFTALGDENPDPKPGLGTRPEVNRARVRPLHRNTITKSNEQYRPLTEPMLWSSKASQKQHSPTARRRSVQNSLSHIRDQVLHSGIPAVEVHHPCILTLNPTRSSHLRAGTLLFLRNVELLCGRTRSGLPPSVRAHQRTLGIDLRNPSEKNVGRVARKLKGQC